MGNATARLVKIVFLPQKTSDQERGRCAGYLPDKPHRAALVALQQSGNLLPEGPPSTVQGRTDQPPHAQPDDDLTAVNRHVPHCPVVVPVHLRRRSRAHRARHSSIPSADRDHDHAAALRHVLDDQRRRVRGSCRCCRQSEEGAVMAGTGPLGIALKHAGTPRGRVLVIAVVSALVMPGGIVLLFA